MAAESSSRFSWMGLNLFFIFIGLVTFKNGLVLIHDLRNWILSDWLINYQGGFVRRGLPGEISLLVSRLSGVSPEALAAVFYLGFYAILLFCFRRLALAAHRDWWMLALIFSPAALSFQILHRWSGFRKEIIYLAAFSWFLDLLRKNVLSPIATALTLTVYAAASTLAHEGLILYFPYFFAALLLGEKTAGEALRLFALPLAAGLLALDACATHPGNAATASQICSSLGYKLQVIPGSTEICASGAIPYLAKTVSEAGTEAAVKIFLYNYFPVFIGFGCLALLPIVGESVVLRRAGKARDVRILWITAAVSFICTLVLFRYAVDWGRWIYIHIMSMTLLLLFINARYKEELDETADLAPAQPRSLGIAYGLMVFVYAAFWVLPNDTEVLRMGYAGRMLQEVHLLARPSNAERMPSD